MIPKRKNIAYVRCSTTEQSPEIQLRDLQAVFILDDCEVLCENESAWRDNVKRPVFEHLSGLIQKGKIDHLYVWDLDRIHRNLNRMQEFFMLCKINGCRIHSYNQQWLEQLNNIMPPFDSIMQDLMINLLGWMGESESTKKSARVKMAIVKKEQGTFSYKGNRWGRKPYPKQTIDRVMELHRKNKSIREIADMVMIYDKNNNAKKISKSGVHKIIVENAREKDSFLTCT